MIEPVRRTTNSFGWKSKLRKADEFSSVFRFRRLQRGEGLDILYRPNSLDYPRLGLVVPKKILPHAVDRNRAKRVLREMFRLSPLELGGLDVVIRVKSAGPVTRFRVEWGTFLLTVKTRSEVI